MTRTKTHTRKLFACLALLFVALFCTSHMSSRRCEMLTPPILPQATPKGFPPKQLGCTRFTTPFPTRVCLRRRSRASTCFEIATRAYISKPISCLRSDVRDLAVCVGSKPEAGIEKRFTLPTKAYENEHLDNTMQCARVRNRYTDGTSATKGTTSDAVRGVRAPARGSAVCSSAGIRNWFGQLTEGSGPSVAGARRPHVFKTALTARADHVFP